MESQSRNARFLGALFCNSPTCTTAVPASASGVIPGVATAIGVDGAFAGHLMTYFGLDSLPPTLVAAVRSELRHASAVAV